MNVYIHIGPPKTATSAIQNWLQSNRNTLLRQGVYYPDHSLDENGVSSGNVLDVFDRTFDKKLVLSEQKVQKLIDECEFAKCHTLLLSSEFFFFQIEELLKAFPQAKLVAYIRFPLDVIESSYNQAVKRHGETKPLGLPKEPKAYHLNLLKNYLTEYGQERFIIRFYEKEILINGDIISDFIGALGLDIEVTPSKVVNHSYSFEALEFKRWLNLFMHDDCQARVDRFLQSYQLGVMNYSVIQPNNYNYYVDWFLIRLEEFFGQFEIQNSQQYLSILRNKTQPEYYKQNIDTQAFTMITKALVEWDLGLSQTLIGQAQENKDKLEGREELYRTFISHKSRRHLVRVWLNEFYYRNYHKLRALYYRLTSIKQDNSGTAVAPIERFRHTLKISDSLSDGEVFRELALLSEQNGELELAYRYMKKADSLRPNGPVITAKLDEYRDKLNIPMDKEKKTK